MKNIVLFTLVLALAAAVVFGAFVVPSALGVAHTAKLSPNVGWNSRACTGNLSAQPVGPVATMNQLAAIKPTVGWNS